MRSALLTCMAAVLVAGCSSSYFERWADREVAPILEDIQEEVNTERLPATPPGVIEPKPEGPSINLADGMGADPLQQAAYGAKVVCGEGYDCLGSLFAALEPRLRWLSFGLYPAGLRQVCLPAWRAAATDAPRIERTRYIDLDDALALAFFNSRDFKNQKESLYLSVLGYTLVRHDFSWRPNASLSGEISTAGSSSGESVDSADARATLSLARRLLSGGSFALGASASQSGGIGGAGTDSNASSLSAGFSHPLLAGTGTAAREALVQAERGLLYDARSFELFRQGLAISTITRYFGLLRQRRFIESAKQRVEQASFLYERSKALFDKGTLTKVDEFRAKQGLLDAANDLNIQAESYSLALDRFKIQLGLPTDENVDVAEESIDPQIIRVDLEAAVATAMENRLDLLTAKQQLEDAERSVQIARNALLPELELFAQAQASSEEDLLNYSRDGGSAVLGLRLSGFADKKAARNAYKSVLIGLTRQRRSYTLSEDNVKLDVRDTVSNLRRAEVSLAIQAEQVQLAEDTVEAALIQLERGEKSNRDVVEAQTQLQDAKNALVRAKVDYLIAVIELRRDMGTLRVNERGQWR